MRKRILSLLLVAAMVLSMVPTAFATSGDGTEGNPYVVMTADELTTAVANGGYIQLGADIDLGKVADPALNFTKDTTLDLNSHKLSCNSYNSSGGDQHFIQVNSGVTLKVVGAGELNVNTASSWGYLLNNSGTVIFAAGTGNVMTLSWGYQFGSGSNLYSGVKFQEGTYKASLDEYYFKNYYLDTNTYQYTHQDGNYVVSLLPDMCTVNGTAYNNLASAITAAKGTEYPIILTEDYTCSTAISDTVTIDGATNGKTLTMTNSISAGTFTGNVVTSKTISGGTFNGAVSSSSYITGGTFNSDVTSTGTIKGGTFAKDITAKDISDGSYDVAVTASGTISGGTFNKTVSAASISGGTFNDTAMVTGAISGGTFNKTVSAASISNGTFNGAATVSGAISGGTFTSTASATSISGGVFANQPTNIAEGYDYAVNSNNSKYMVTSAANVDTTNHKVTNGAYAKYYGVSEFIGADNTALTAYSYSDYVVKTVDVKDGGLYKGIYNFSMSYVFADGYMMSNVKDADNNYVYIVGKSITTDSYKITSGTFLDDPTAYVDTTKYNVTSSEGTYTVSLKDDAVVATITETGAKYVTLQKAFGAVAEGQTIVLQKDSTENAGFSNSNGKTITLDLNGHTLSSTTGNTLTVSNCSNKVFTIKDSSETKTGKITATNGTAVYVGSSSSFEKSILIEGGTFEGTNAIYAYGSGYWYKTYVTINGGTFKGAMAKGGSNSGAYAYYTISAGAFSVDPSTISGATINGDVTHDETAGTYTVTPAYYTITAGTSEHGTVLVNGESSVTVLKNSTVTLTNTPDEGYLFKSYMNGETAISGTTITATADATITGVFSLKPYVNKTTNTFYDSITDAFSAASNGDTIQMQADDELTRNVSIGTSGKSVTLDLNGHTLDGRYDYYGSTVYRQITTNGTVTIISSVDDGKILPQICVNDTVNVQSGKFCNISAGSSSAVLNISGGEEISGGYINFSSGGHRPVNITGGIVQEIYNAVFNITGGYVVDFKGNYAGSGTITGGEFTVDVTDYVIAGYKCEAIPEGQAVHTGATYRVVEDSNATKPAFVTFAESETGTDFTLTEDLDLTSYVGTIEFVGTKTVDLNGHTLTVNPNKLIVSSGTLTFTNNSATNNNSKVTEVVGSHEEKLSTFDPTALITVKSGAKLVVNENVVDTEEDNKCLIDFYGNQRCIYAEKGSGLDLNGGGYSSYYDGAIIAGANTTINIDDADVVSEGSVNNYNQASYAIRVNDSNITLKLTNTSVTGVQGAVGVSGTGTTAEIRNCYLASHYTNNDSSKGDAFAALYVAVNAMADVYDTWMYSPRTNYAAYNGNNDTTPYFATINLHSGCYLSDKGYNEEDSGVIAPADSLPYIQVNTLVEGQCYTWYIGAPAASITTGEGDSAETTNYATLAAAVNAATVSSGAITLLQDDSTSFTLPAGATFDTSTFNYTGTVSAPEGYQLKKVSNDQGGYIYSVFKAVASITADGTTTYYATLADAVEAASLTEATTIKMLDDDTIASQITINKDITIDFNGQTISSACNPFLIEGGKLTLDGTGTLNECTSGYPTAYHGIQIMGSTESTATNYSVLNIKSGVKVVSGGYVAAVSNNSNCAYGVVVNVDGATLESAYGFTINGNVNKTEGNIPQFNLTDVTMNAGIYGAGYAVWTLNNCSMTANDGDALSLKSGKFTINSGTYTSGGPYASPATDTSNGSADTGAALSMTPNDAYAAKLDVVVNGGTFISEHGNAVYEGIPNNATTGTPVATTSYVTLAINGGLFKSASDKDCVVLTDMTNKNVISGGYFSTTEAQRSAFQTAYVAENYYAIPNEETNKSTYPTKIGVTTDKVVVTVSSALMGSDGTIDYNTTVGTMSDGGEYTKNAKFAITAPTVDGYQFVGWYQNKVKACDTTTITLTATSDTTLHAVYIATSTSVNVKATANGNGTVTYGSSTGTTAEGTTTPGNAVTITATASEGKRFAYWKNSSGKVISTQASYTTTAVQAVEVEAVFNDSGAATVVFKDGSGNNILGLNTYTTDDEIANITKVIAPSKMGSKFTGWEATKNQTVVINGQEETIIAGQTLTDDQAAAIARSAGGKTVTVQANYQASGTYQINVTPVINGATTTKKADILTITQNIGTPSVVTVDAQSKLGVPFDHLVIDGQTIYSKSFTVNPYAEKTYTCYAYYVTDSKTNETAYGSITVNHPTASYTNSEKVDITMSWYLPEGATFLESGFYRNSDSSKVTSHDSTVKYNGTVKANSGSITRHIQVQGHLEAVQYCQAYVTYTYDGQTYTMYSSTIGTKSFALENPEADSGALTIDSYNTLKTSYFVESN